MTTMVMNYRNISKMRYFNNVSNFVRSFVNRMKYFIRLNCDKNDLESLLKIRGSRITQDIA